jgi:hypothetical protein
LGLDYKEYLKLPEVEEQFDSMFTEKREYYRIKCEHDGFDKEHQEILGIKLAMITTDLCFTEIHRAKYRQ